MRNSYQAAVAIWPCAWRGVVCLALGLLILAGFTKSAAAQAAAFAFVGDSTAANTEGPTFILPGQPTEVTEALDDMARHMEKARWELAFKSLDQVLKSKSDGMVKRADGVMVPRESMIRHALAALPPEGRQAYQLFHDAEAKALLADATGEQEIEKLNEILARYVITSVGDVAADRLGDIHFERGKMRRAAACWKLILEARPDSALSRPLLLVKMGIASARAGRLDEMRQARRELEQRHPGAEVELGGRSVNAAEHLTNLQASLASSVPKNADQTTTASDQMIDVTLPEETEPLWKFRFFSQTDIEALKSAGNNWGSRRMPVNDMVPPTVIDDERLYVNLLGYFFALDLRSGKLLWRSGKFHEATKNVNRGPYFSVERYSLAVSGDRLWAVARPVSQIGQHGAHFLLTCRKKDDGTEIWNSGNVDGLKQWNMAGTPLPVGDRVFVPANERNQGTKLHVLALDAADGKLLWSTHVGTHQVDHSQVYYRKTPQPVLLADNENVIVETHDGALAMLHAESGKLLWGVPYESKQLDTQHWYNQPAEMTTSGVPLLADGVLFFKGMLSDRLYAVDPAGPVLRWKRPVSRTAILVGLDDERLYLSGEELTAIDRESRQLVWSNKLPQGTSWLRPVLTRTYLYQFTPRGIYEIDKLTGDLSRLFRGDDLDSLGGVILATPDALVTVSNLAVTAYPVQRDSSTDDSSVQAAASR